MSRSSSDSSASNDEEYETSAAKKNTKNKIDCYCHPINLHISSIANCFEIPQYPQPDLSFQSFPIFCSLIDKDNAILSDSQSNQLNNDEKDDAEKLKKHEKKSKKHKEKSKKSKLHNTEDETDSSNNEKNPTKKAVFHHFVRSNTLRFPISQSDPTPSSPLKQNLEEESSNQQQEDFSSSNDSPLLPQTSTENSNNKLPPPSSCPPPPPSSKPSSPKKPPPSSCPPPPPLSNSSSPKKPPPSTCSPPPPSKSSSSKKPPPSSRPPPPPPKNSSPQKPPPSSKPPTQPSKKPPPSSNPPPPPPSSSKPPSPSKTNSSSNLLPQNNSDFTDNIPLSKTNNRNDNATRLQNLRKVRQKSSTVSFKRNPNSPLGFPNFRAMEEPKDTSSIEDVLESSTSNTFLLPPSHDSTKEPLSEQQIIQSYFLKKDGKNEDENEIIIDSHEFEKNSKRNSHRIRFDRNSSYSNSLFSNIIDNIDLVKIAQDSLNEYNKSIGKNSDDEGKDSLDNDNDMNQDKNVGNDDENTHDKLDDNNSRPMLSPASSDPRNLEKLAKMNKKAKQILIKRFKKMLENYISEVEINSDFIEIDTSRDSTIHWRKDPHLIKTNELRVESRELENKIASIRIENKDLQNSITEMYQTIGNKNQELMKLQMEISRLKGSSDI